MPGKTRENRINTVYGGGGHVVILGAGASIASTLRNPEISGKQLPSMDNFVEVVGLQDIVADLPRDLREKNFEILYSKLHRDNPSSDIICEIESRVRSYFKDMKLPEKEATIYDYLVLALRPRDTIATFNWDPFLLQAFYRNKDIADSPYMQFLHGCVALGYSEDDNQSGPAGWNSKETGNYFRPTKILYPVEQKNYTDDAFIKQQWEWLKSDLGDKVTKRVSIFGYGAPDTDVEAMKLMEQAWGGSKKRDVEQFEMIDIQEEAYVRARWKKFIHTHHYDYCTSYFESSLATNPRRTFESYMQHNFPITIDEAFSKSNPVPKDIHLLEDLQAWHQPLIEAEKIWKEENPEQVWWKKGNK